jgi:hypothetical protein
VKKRIQNKTAESRRTLSLAILYGTAIWVLAGLFQEQWWVQFACFVLSALLVMRINSKNLLIRIFSRSVSVAFIFLSCAAVFLFPSWSGGIAQLCCIAALMLLFDCYQDPTAVGKTYYAFLILGIGSMLDATIIFYLPLLWIMMKIIAYTLSWRTFFASLLGLVTPYWFMCGWLMWQKNSDFHAIFSLFAVQDILEFPFDFSTVPLSYQLIMAFTTLLMVIGSMHFVHSSFRDKIRVRQIYYGFITLGLYSLAILVLQPHNELALRMLILAASPLIGHYWALTNSRISNIIFIIISLALVALTAYNLWISLSVS